MANRPPARAQSTQGKICQFKLVLLGMRAKIVNIRLHVIIKFTFLYLECLWGLSIPMPPLPTLGWTLARPVVLLNQESAMNKNDIYWEHFLFSFLFLLYIGDRFFNFFRLHPTVPHSLPFSQANLLLVNPVLYYALWRASFTSSKKVPLEVRFWFPTFQPTDNKWIGHCMPLPPSLSSFLIVCSRLCWGNGE